MAWLRRARPANGVSLPMNSGSNPFPRDNPHNFCTTPAAASP